ncbi:hypothetical protein HK101_005725 [Irineochytrium annulatum]|nr:hypothetical protein HK101_005725 [Irineochytrium annulatum]
MKRARSLSPPPGWEADVWLQLPAEMQHAIVVDGGGSPVAAAGPSRKRARSLAAQRPGPSKRQRELEVICVGDDDDAGPGAARLATIGSVSKARRSEREVLASLFATEKDLAAFLADDQPAKTLAGSASSSAAPRYDEPLPPRLLHACILPPNSASYQRRDPSPNCMAATLYSPGVDFIQVVFRGDRSSDVHLAAYAQFLQNGFEGWEFLTVTRSQRVTGSLGCWMARGHARNAMLDGTGLGAIADRGKFIKYSGLMFNVYGEPVVRIEGLDVTVEKDVTRNGFCFTDGCGRASPEVVKELAAAGCVDKDGGGRTGAFVPAALQIRGCGVKGMLTLDERLMGRKIVLRDSMKKLKVRVEDRTRPNKAVDVLQRGFLDLVVIGKAKPSADGPLNSQIIALLIERGVPTELLLEIDNQYKDAVRFMAVDVLSAFDFLYLCGNSHLMAKLLRAIRNPTQRARGRGSLRQAWNDLRDRQLQELSRWRKRVQLDHGGDSSRPVVALDDDDNNALLALDSLGRADPMRRVYIPLRDARLVYGVADPTGLLRAGEVHICVATADPPGVRGVERRGVGMVRVLEGEVCYVRNPCYHASDIRVVKAVWVKELAHLEDVVVFSTEGNRPAADMASGGDLDGDRFLIIWDQRIVAAVQPMEAFDYTKEGVKETIQRVAKKLGVEAYSVEKSSPSAGRDKDLIKLLTSNVSRDELVCQIDSMLVQLRRFEFPDVPVGQPTRQDLLDILNALFSAGIDEMGLNISFVLHAVERYMIRTRTPTISPLDSLLQKCLRRTDADVDFIEEEQRPYIQKLWDLFVESSARLPKDVTERDDPALTFNYTPPRRRDTAALTARVLRLREVDGSAVDLDDDGGLAAVEGSFGAAIHTHLQNDTAMWWKCNVTFLHAQSANVRAQLAGHVVAVRRRALNAAIQNRDAVVAAAFKGSKSWAEVDAYDDEVEEARRMLEAEGKASVEEYRRLRGEARALKDRATSLVGVAKGVENLFERMGEVIDASVLVECDKVVKLELLMFDRELPIYGSRAKLVDGLLKTRMSLILSATGSGKSTCIPQFLYNELFFRGELSPSKKILVAQPRRTASSSLADHLSKDRRSAIGDHVGLHLGRQRARINKDRTIIECMTYGMMLQYAARDHLFMNYSVVVLDEVHEGCAELQFLFGIVKHAMEQNPALRLIMMSAKVDTDQITEFFPGCDIIDVMGRSFPIEEAYGGPLKRSSGMYIRSAVDQVVDLHVRHPLRYSPDGNPLADHVATPYDANPDILMACDFLPEILALRVGAQAASHVHAFEMHSGVEDAEKKFVLERGDMRDWPGPKVGAAWEEDEVLDAGNGKFVAEEMDVLLRIALKRSMGEEVDEKAIAVMVEEQEEALRGPKPNGLKKTKAQKRKEADERRAKAQEKKSAIDGTRRVIFCTNIAETSLTFPSIGFVIDSGLQWSVNWSHNMRIQSSRLSTTSVVSAVQRKGRAGRLGPGFCYRLYSVDDFVDFPNQTFSYIPLDSQLLFIARHFGDYTQFPFYRRPTTDDFIWTLYLLRTLGFLVEDAFGDMKLTADGEAAQDLTSRFQLPAQSARFLLDCWSVDAGDVDHACRELACFLAGMGAVNVSMLCSRAFSYTCFIESVSAKEGPMALSLPAGWWDVAVPASVAMLNVFCAFRRRGRKGIGGWCRFRQVEAGEMESLDGTVMRVQRHMKAREVGRKRWNMDEAAWLRPGSGSGKPKHPPAPKQNASPTLMSKAGMGCTAEENYFRMQMRATKAIERADGVIIVGDDDDDNNDDWLLDVGNWASDVEGDAPAPSSTTAPAFASILRVPAMAAMDHAGRCAFLLERLASAYYTNLALVLGERQACIMVDGSLQRCVIEDEGRALREDSEK